MKYKFNENYFEKIDSYNKAYLLGYLFSDGCVRNIRNINILKLKLHKKDKHILEFLQQEISSNCTIIEEKGTNCLSITVCSKKISEDLIKLGCVPTKSLILKFPNIDKQYYNSFIHGYFDGDGCIYFAEKKETKSAQRQFKLLGTNEFLTSIKKYFIEIGINTYDVMEYPNSKIFQLRTCNKKSIQKIYNNFYLDSNYTYLDRKKEIFEKAII